MSEFDKIIGYESEKEELARLCGTLKNRAKYAKLGNCFITTSHICC